MNISLIGYRGTGKSTIARLLADKLGMAYVGMDSEIEKLAGMTIPQIVAAHSWDHFRDLESQVVATFTGRDGQVLDTGGGVITRAENRDLLKRHSVVVLLDASVEDIVQRIGGDANRPSLTGTKTITEEVVDVLQERQPLYEETAQYRVNTSAGTPEAMVSEIIRMAGLSDRS